MKKFLKKILKIFIFLFIASFVFTVVGLIFVTRSIRNTPPSQEERPVVAIQESDSESETEPEELEEIVDEVDDPEELEEVVDEVDDPESESEVDELATDLTLLISENHFSDFFSLELGMSHDEVLDIIVDSPFHDSENVLQFNNGIRVLNVTFNDEGTVRSITTMPHSSDFGINLDDIEIGMHIEDVRSTLGFANSGGVPAQVTRVLIVKLYDGENVKINAS